MPLASAPELEFALLYLLLSFFKVNCSPSVLLRRGEVSSDYLAVKMIKVTAHLCAFPSCRLRVRARTRGMRMHMFC